MSKLLRNLLIVSAVSFVLADKVGSRKRTIDFFGDNQAYFNKKDRFIKFDTKDNELEIELGFSIPVVKVPLLAPTTGKHAVEEPSITVNAPGLVISGALMLATFFIVPLLFSKSYSDLRTGRSDEGEDAKTGDFIQQSIYENFANSSACMKTLLCWTASKFEDSGEGSIGKWMDNIFKYRWIEQLVRGTFVEEAISTGRSGEECWRKYHDCPILKKLASK